MFDDIIFESTFKSFRTDLKVNRLDGIKLMLNKFEGILF